jgi:AcrR family transcriptional regulator
MARSTVGEDEFLDKTMELFLEQGFAGTSVSQIAAATGLEKASLYYRYPGGKDEIALAVAARIGAWLAEHVVGPLAGDGQPEQLAREAARQLRGLYRDGTRWCGLEVLSLKGGGKELAEGLKGALTSWIGAFTGIARRSGMPAPMARQRAETVIAQIEGGLVLARVLGDARPFKRALDAMPALLTRA